jgi:hypothetical protein
VQAKEVVAFQEMLLIQVSRSERDRFAGRL